ncbi:hypothetical protein BKA83DRAFT_4498673 [Pisolithus microcarpus]|nr:hypothetical protein BKA83DRAFT_4498673 [Pisolithus microcarpus]
MPIQQVIQCFTQQYACSNSANEWNTYQQYFAAHKAQELQRLPSGDDLVGMLLEKMSKCYKLFCEQFPDTYKQILAVYKDTVVLGNTDKTVTQCQQLFHNTSKQLMHLFNSIAKCHAFEGAFLLAGSIINQDGGIGCMHTTPHAENFFLEWCHADEDEMLHLKSRSKGISDLTLVECGILIAALTDKSKDGLHFVVKLDAHDALYYSCSPVIYSAPPDSNSKHAFAKRMYANLKCNHNGAACKSSTSATRLKKKKTGKSMHNIEVISIPNSDEIISNMVPHAKVKRPVTSVHDSDEIKEIPPVVRKSTQLQPRSEENNDDSVDIGDSEYNPDDKASTSGGFEVLVFPVNYGLYRGSNTEEARVSDAGSVLEDERQSLSCKHKCTFDDTGHALKRLAINPKPVMQPSINPVSLSYKGKGKSSSIAADVAVENEDDTLEDERHMSYESRTTFNDTECTSKRPAISPMLIESPPTCPAVLSSRDKGNSQTVIDNKTTDVSPHAKSGLDASEANQSLHAISSTLLPSPDKGGCVEIPKKIQQKSPIHSIQHWSSDLPGSPQMPPANHPLHKPAKDSPPIMHPSDKSQVSPSHTFIFSLPILAAPCSSLQ